MYIFMHIVSCYNVKDVHYSVSENIHLHKTYYISGRWRREEGAGTPKSTIKSMHWKVALKRKVQLLFLSRKGRIFISKKAFP